jgi:hypothetical protein
MSFSIYYTSARKVTPEEADAIRAAATEASKGRSWLSCEPVDFFPDVHDGKLLGASKPNFRPQAEDKRAAESSGLPDGKPSDLLDILASISREHKVDWELMHDYGPVGSIREGVVDPEALAQIEAISKPWWKIW